MGSSGALPTALNGSGPGWPARICPRMTCWSTCSCRSAH